MINSKPKVWEHRTTFEPGMLVKHTHHSAERIYRVDFCVKDMVYITQLYPADDPGLRADRGTTWNYRGNLQEVDLTDELKKEIAKANL